MSASTGSSARLSMTCCRWRNVTRSICARPHICWPSSGWPREARDVAFVIGGATGLDPAVFDRCDGRLSLSTWTLPHELARLVLLEQIYRAGTILRGEPYHKGSR